MYTYDIDAAIKRLGYTRRWLSGNGFYTYVGTMGSNSVVGEIFFFVYSNLT